MSKTLEPAGNPAARRPRAHAWVWLGRAALVLFVTPIVLAALGAFYQAIATSIDRRQYRAPGQLVDVGGYRLHLFCMGEGSPAVILDAANMGTVSSWAWIQPELAKATRVCAYDRAGLGWSDLSPAPQDTRQNAEALHTLLTRQGIAPPYVLVGHSLGGLYTRMYAEMYPSEVAGAVFIEGTPPDTLRVRDLPDTMPNAPAAGFMNAMPAVSRLGILRLMHFPASDPDLPARQRQELGAYLASPKLADLLEQQYRMFPTLLAQVRPLYGPGQLGAIPEAVILGREGDGGVTALSPLFEQQAALSQNGRIYWVEGASHVSLVHRKEHAQQTCAAILEVVEAARQ